MSCVSRHMLRHEVGTRRRLDRLEGARLKLGRAVGLVHRPRSGLRVVHEMFHDKR
jgi:hypothetical protein